MLRYDVSLARAEAIYLAIILAGCMGLRRSEALGMRHIRFHDLRHPYVKHTTKFLACA